MSSVQQYLIILLHPSHLIEVAMPPPVKIPTRTLGHDGPEVAAIGFGLMGLSIAYGKVE